MFIGYPYKDTTFCILVMYYASGVLQGGISVFLA